MLNPDLASLGDFNGNALCTAYKTKSRCTHLNRNVIIGMGATLLAGATIGSYSVTGIKSLVDLYIPEKVLALVASAKVSRRHADLHYFAR